MEMKVMTIIICPHKVIQKEEIYKEPLKDFQINHKIEIYDKNEIQ